MPLLRSATRPQAVECFFCLSPSVLPPQPSHTGYGGDQKGKRRALAEVGTKWNWECKRCLCWNTRDENGEMRSDHPAMHDPAFNTRSFALRASTSTSHLPSASLHSARLFCHSCLANQTLIMNMLANYLPDDDDPSYPELYSGLPSYLASLHGRYPPVCPQCQPAVDEALRKADQKAQVEAWGSALRRGQNTGSRDDAEAQRPGKLEVLVWRARGVGFWTTAIISWCVCITGVAAPARSLVMTQRHDEAGLWLLALHLTSILWFAWDPHWLYRRRNRHLGKTKGRETWVRCMLLVLLSRLITSYLIISPQLRALLPFDWVLRGALVIEIAAYIAAFAALRTPQPIALRLIRPTQLSVPVSPSYPVSATALHSNQPNNHNRNNGRHTEPSTPTYHPVFGETSLAARPAHSRLYDNDMEWEATPPPPLYNGGYTSSGPARHEAPSSGNGHEAQWDNFAVGKQRLFGQKEGEDETGLEGLLAGWGLAEQVGAHAPGAGGAQIGWGEGAIRWLKGGKGRIN